MLQLVYKDILLQRRTTMNLIIITLMCVSASVALTVNATFGYFAVIMTAYMSINYVNSYDFKYKTEIVFRSLPISRDLIVGARYISALLYLLVPLALVIVLRLILCAAGMFPLASLMRPEFLIQATGIGLLFFAIYLPFNFKLGYMKSRWFNIVGMGVAYGLPISLVKIVEEKAKSGTLVIPGTWYETSQEALALLTGTSTGLWNLVLSLTCVTALFISYLISRRIYRDRDCSF